MGAIVAGALVLACLMAPGLAGATYEPLSSGTTKLTLDKSFLGLLRANGVKLGASAPAKLSGGAVSFAVVGGKIDPLTTNGTIEHEGTLLLKAGNRSLPLRSWQLKTTQRRAPFSAKVGGSQLKLASAEKLAVSPAGFAERVKVTKLALSAKLATRLSKKLRLPGVFQAGQPLGSTTTTAVPATVALKGSGKVSLTLAPGFAAKLDSLFVAVNPISPAERPGPFTFPIFSGQLAPSAVTGTLDADGSLEFLQLGGGQVFWANPGLDFATGAASAEVDLQPYPPYPGKIGRVPVATLSLAGAAVSSDPKSRTIAVAGAPLALDGQMAAAFNQAFAQGKSVFGGGEAVGSVSFAAVGE